MNIEFRNFHGPSDWGVVQQHMPLKRVEDTGGIVAVDKDTNETVAIAVMDSWTWNSVQIHQLILNPLVLRHGFFEEVADYVFNVADREIMIGLVPSDNEAALSVNKKIGFEEVARIKDAVNFGIDVVILSMHKTQCKYWTERPPEQAREASNGR